MLDSRFQRSVVPPHRKSRYHAHTLCFLADSSPFTQREIVERRSFVQVRKIAVSAALYAGVIIITIGCSMQAAKRLHFHSHFVPTLPLEWHPHEALASTPFDLLALLFLLRPAVRYLKVESVARKAFKRWWVAAAHELRLTSFLLGGRPGDEEGSHVRFTWQARLLFRKAPVNSKGHPTGPAPPGVMFVPDAESDFARVPGDDHSTPGPLLIRTDENGNPVTDAGLRALQKQQEAEAARQADPAHIANTAASGMPLKAKFTIVYLPPHFRLRLIAFLVALWLSLCWCIVVALDAPLSVGRNLVSRTGMAPLHDLYTWVLGAAVIVGVWTTVGAIVDSKTLKKWNKGRLFRRSNLARVRLRAIRFARRAWIITAVSRVGTVLG